MRTARSKIPSATRPAVRYGLSRIVRSRAQQRKLKRKGGAGDCPRPGGTLTIRGGRRRLRYWFIAARRGFTHCVLSFSGGQQGGGSAIPHRAATGKRQSDCCSGHVVRHFGDEHSVMLAKRKIAVLYSAAQFFNRGAHCFKAILRMRDKLRHCFGGIADLVQKTRHGLNSFRAGVGTPENNEDAPVPWESQEGSEK